MKTRIYATPAVKGLKNKDPGCALLPGLPVGGLALGRGRTTRLEFLPRVHTVHTDNFLSYHDALPQKLYTRRIRTKVLDIIIILCVRIIECRR